MDMGDLVIALGLIGPPLLLIIAALLFSWDYRRRVEKVMHQSLGAGGSRRSWPEFVSQRRESRIRVPLTLRRIEGTALETLSHDLAEAWNHVLKRRRSLIIAAAIACVIYYAASAGPVLSGYNQRLRPGPYRVPLLMLVAFYMAAPQIGLALIWARAGRRLWATLALCYFGVSVLVIILFGLTRFPVLVARSTLYHVFLPLPGLIIVTSRWLRPVATALVALMVAFISVTCLFAYALSPNAMSELQAASQQPTVLATVVVSQLVGTLVFIWLLGRESILIPTVVLFATAIAGHLLDLATTPPVGTTTWLLVCLLLGLPEIVLLWSVAWLLFKALNLFTGKGLHTSRLLQLYFGWIYLTIYEATWAYLFTPSAASH